MSPVEAIHDVMCGMKKLNYHNDFVSGIVSRMFYTPIILIKKSIIHIKIVVHISIFSQFHA